MSKIIYLAESEELEIYNPIYVFNEDKEYDNCFCILKTCIGNIAFSYYNLGMNPNFIIQNNILFLSFGISYYVINLGQGEILYQSNNSISAIFEIVKCDAQSCIVFIGEILLICFSFEGYLIWKNNYTDAILDWVVYDKEILLAFENGKKLSVSFDDGNGIF